MSAALQEIREARTGDANPVTEVAAQPAQAAEQAPATEGAAPAATPAPTPAPKAAEAAAPAAAPAAEETPEQKLAKTQAELHRAQSEIGRVSALNRKTQDQAQRIAELERELQSARKPPETQAEALAQFDQLAEKVKDFPELLSVVQTVGAALKEVKDSAQATATQAAQQALAPIEPLRRQHMEQQSKDMEAANAADMSTFQTTYPTAREVIVSEDFKAWLPKAPMAIQFSFRKGETPGEAIAVMDAYDAHLRRSGKPSIARTPTTTQQPPAAEPAKQPDNKRLSQAAGLPSRATGNAKGSLPPEDDFDGSLEFFRNKRLQAQRAAA